MAPSLLSNHVAPLGFFPPVYEGEILYSILARYSFLRGYTSHVLLHAELFGRRRGGATVDLPSDLDAIACRLPVRFELDGEGLAMAHTLMPYYAAALNPKRRATLLAAMRSFGERPSLSVGKRSGWIQKPTHLKFCHICMLDMQARGEELHWLRVHQLSIVLVCPVHSVPLQRGPALGRYWIYHPANEQNCAPDAPACHVPQSVAEIDALAEIATLAREMLASPSRRTTMKPTAVHFGKAFRQRGYQRGERVNFLSLAPAARDVLEILEPAFPGLLDRGRAKPVWLDHLVDGRTAQQADTIVVAKYLLRHLPKGSSVDEPFGPAPWSCFNPFTPHNNERVIFRRDGLRLMNGRWRARFHCDCGYSYTSTRQPDGTLRIKTLKIGPLLKEFIEVAKAEKLSLPAAAKRMGVTSFALVGLGLREGINMPWGKPGS